jgi:hypothetical protein
MPQLNKSNGEVSSQLNGTDRFNWTGGIKISQGRRDRRRFTQIKNER